MSEKEKILKMLIRIIFYTSVEDGTYYETYGITHGLWAGVRPGGQGLLLCPEHNFVTPGPIDLKLGI